MLLNIILYITFISVITYYYTLYIAPTPHIPDSHGLIELWTVECDEHTFDLEITRYKHAN